MHENGTCHWSVTESGPVQWLPGTGAVFVPVILTGRELSAGPRWSCIRAWVYKEAGMLFQTTQAVFLHVSKQLLGCGREVVPMTLMDQYQSIWYGLECHENCIQCRSGSQRVPIDWYRWKAPPQCPRWDRALQHELWPCNTSAIQPSWGGHKYPPASGISCKAGSYNNLCSYSDVVVLAVRLFRNSWSIGTLGGLRYWTKWSWHSSPYHIHVLRYQSIKVIGTTPLPQPNRVQHNFTVAWMWQDRRGSLEQHTRPHDHRHTSSPHTWPWQLQSWFYTHAEDWTLHCTRVQYSCTLYSLYTCTSRSVVHLVSTTPGIASSPWPLEADHWKHPTYPSCVVSACKASTTTSKILLEAGHLGPAGNPRRQWAFGTKMDPVHGHYCGPLSVTLKWHVPFSCTAAAWRHAWKDANATAQVSDARPFPNIKSGVLITRAMMTSTYCWHHRAKAILENVHVCSNSNNFPDVGNCYIVPKAVLDLYFKI